MIADTEYIRNRKCINYLCTIPKLQAIQNEYKAGKLTVIKTVAGNGGDQTKYSL
jgi:hypothetical protein